MRIALKYFFFYFFFTIDLNTAYGRAQKICLVSQHFLKFILIMKNYSVGFWALVFSVLLILYFSGQGLASQSPSQ